MGHQIAAVSSYNKHIRLSAGLQPIYRPGFGESIQSPPPGRIFIHITPNHPPVVLQRAPRHYASMADFNKKGTDIWRFRRCAQTKPVKHGK
jgi:hypothetical protein